MNIELGKTEVSLLNPPDEGMVRDGETEWKISRNGSGMIVLRSGGTAHPEFFEGMDMAQFCRWINSKL